MQTANPPVDPMTAPNPHLPARLDWLALRQEEILEPPPVLLGERGDIRLGAAGPGQ